MDPLPIVAVLGASPEACDIARARAHAGEVVRLYVADSGELASAIDRIRAAVEHAVRAGHFTPGDRQRTLDGIVLTTDLDEAVSGASMVIDARG